MSDTDLIACLFAADDPTTGFAALTISQNTLRCASQVSIPAEYLSPGATGAPLQISEPHLQLRFSQGPSKPPGFVLGTDSDCDIVLPSLRYLGRHHAIITFDTEGRLILTDLGYGSGTSVSYDGHAENEVRNNFTWIIQPDSFPWETSRVVIKFHEHLIFSIVVFHRASSSSRFPQGRNATGSLSSLGTSISSRGVQQRLGKGAIILKRKLGEGHFSTVSHAWDVSSGEQCAIKEPFNKPNSNVWIYDEAFRNEARFMKRFDHNHIVTFLGSELSTLQLRFEYVPGGCLNDAGNLSKNECVQVLFQVTSALEYLHGFKRPIVHRDLKPEKILIQKRTQGQISIKLAAFGLSKSGHSLRTQYDTLRYVAPEIFKLDSEHDSSLTWKKCTPAVDLWSLGVLIMELAVGLPVFQTYGPQWCKDIITKFQEATRYSSDDGLARLLACMLKLNPTHRASAAYCRYTAEELLNSLPNVESITHSLVVAIGDGKKVKRKRSVLSQPDDDEGRNEEVKRRFEGKDEEEMDPIPGWSSGHVKRKRSASSQLDNEEERHEEFKRPFRGRDDEKVHFTPRWAIEHHDTPEGGRSQHATACGFEEVHSQTPVVFID